MEHYGPRGQSGTMVDFDGAVLSSGSTSVQL